MVQLGEWRTKTFETILQPAIECRRMRSWQASMMPATTRDGPMPIAPLFSTMSPAAAYTGRLPSEASMNFGVASRFRSRTPYCETPSD